MGKVYFYFLPFCPRSYFSFLNLKKVKDEILTFDIVLIRSFSCRKNGKFYFPPVIYTNEKILSGFFLSYKKISNFLKENL